MSDLTAAPVGGLVARYALPPAEIEAQSLAIVGAEIGGRFADEQDRTVATRILYAAGDANLASRLLFSKGASVAGVEALIKGCNIVADVRMVLAGLDQARLRTLGCPVHCAIDDAGVAERARRSGTPRAVEAIRALAPVLDGAVVVIGNAPTALLALLDMVDAGEAHPALVVGMPVGFVAATEAKSELCRRSVPSITIAGTRGGSPLAAAALNALLRLATPDSPQRDRSRTAILFAGHGSRAVGAAETMLVAVDNVRRRGLFPIVETGYLELCQPDLPAALRACVEQGATRVLVIPYFLHNGMHIQRDIPAVMRRELALYPSVSVSIGRPIGLHADFANVMLAGAQEAEDLRDLRDEPEYIATAGALQNAVDDDD